MKNWFNNLHLNDKTGKPSTSTQVIGCAAMVIIQLYLFGVLYTAFSNILPSL